MKTTTALDGGRGREGVFLRILDGDTIVGTSECTWRRCSMLLVLVVGIVERVVVIVKEGSAGGESVGSRESSSAGRTGSSRRRAY